MKVLSLFADGTVSEVILELCAPDPGGDPVKATVVGADDAAIRVSAERAVKTGYFLLMRRGYDASKLRYFASFDLDVPAGVPVSGDSAAVAFLIKFLTAIVEQESGRDYRDRAVAATGVIPEASADARVGRVDGIAEKIRAAHAALPPGAQILLPAENLTELQDTGELVLLEPGAISRLKSVRDIGDVMDWVDATMPLETHLPARTKIAYADPSLAAQAAREQESRRGPTPRPPTPPAPTLHAPAPRGPTPAPAAFARPAPASKSGVPLWVKRVALYAFSFSIGPLALLIAMARAGTTQGLTAPHPPPQPTAAATATLTPPPVKPTPAEPASDDALGAEEEVSAGPAPEIAEGYFEYETAPGVRSRVGLKGKDYIQLDAPVPSGCQISFRSLRFSDTAYFYIVSCEPREPFLALLFPRPGSKVQNPLPPESPGGPYNVPSFPLGSLPENTHSVYETIYLVSSSIPRTRIGLLIREFYNVVNENPAKARMFLLRLTEMLEAENPLPGLKVVRIQFEHVEGSRGTTKGTPSP